MEKSFIHDLRKVERSLRCGREDGTWWRGNNFKEKKIVLSTEAKRNGEIFIHALRKVERSLHCGREDGTWRRGLENCKEKAKTRSFEWDEAKWRNLHTCFT